jgi:hypothetical protein
VAERTRSDVYRMPSRYNDQDDRIQYIDYSFEPSDYSWRRYRVQPQEGHNSEFPQIPPARFRVDDKDLQISRSPTHVNERS